MKINIIQNGIQFLIGFILLYQISFSQTDESIQQNLTIPFFSDSVILIAAGDLLLGASAEPVIRSMGIDAPFDSVKFYIQKADIALANLEAPFAKSGVGEPYQKQFHFKVPPQFATGLVSAGFNLVTFANNHVMDYGEQALQSTIQILDSLNILHCGAGMTFEDAYRPAQLSRNGLKFGFLAYSLTYPDSFWAVSGRGGTAFPASMRMKHQICELKASTDFVIVSFHWGGEKLSTPKDYQQRYAHQAIDAGADVIIGHHPHVVQGVEIYKNKLIAYSLGNFVFGSYSPYANGALLKIVFHPNKGIKVQILPINVNNYQVHFQPRLLRQNERDQMIQHINTISQPLNHGVTPLDSTGFIYLLN